MSNPFKLDCADNSCYYAEQKSGMRTNGGCRCISISPESVQRKLRYDIALLKNENAELKAKLEIVIEALKFIDEYEEGFSAREALTKLKELKESK